jgi:hypothetical protein
MQTDRNTRRNHFRTWPLSIVIAGLGFLTCPALFAQESATQLRVHGTYPNAQEKSDRCAKFWQELNPLLQTIKAANESTNYDKLKPNLLGRAFAQASAMLREGDALKNMGETAGVDWSIRGDLARNLISGAITHSMSTKAGSDLAKKASQYQARTDKKRNSDIAKIKKLFDQKKIDEAETAINQLLYDIDTFYPWVTQQEQQGIAAQTRGVLDLLSQVHAQIRPARRKQLGMEAIKKLGINVNELIRDAETAALEIRADGKTNIGGSSYEGHAAFKHLSQRWLELRKRFLNALGYSVMVDNVWDSKCNEVLGVDSAVNDWKMVDTELTKRMSAALLKIIDSDTSRAAVSDLPQAYQAYLSAAAGLAIELDDSKFAAQCETGLTALAKTDASFGAKVENYQKATSELLIWQNRMATSRAQGRQQNSKPILDQVDTQDLLPSLRSSVPECMVALESKIGSTTDFKTAFTRDGRTFGSLDDRIWYSMLGEFHIAAADRLVKALYAEDSPPLSLAATIAVDTARAGHFERVGGQVSAISAHAMSTHFIQLQNEANYFCPPSKTPAVPPGLDNVLLEVQVRPEWVQHRYFFVDLKK